MKASKLYELLAQQKTPEGRRAVVSGCLTEVLAALNLTLPTW